jgi:hypothetical protein
MAQQKTTITLNKKYNKVERKAIAQDVLDYIRQRTAKEGKDRYGRSMGTYSKSYKNSLAFKQKRSKSLVNLTLTGDMLTDMDLLNDRSGQITIGFQDGTHENAKAQGHISGKLGRARAKPRDFLGISNVKLQEILKKYPLRDELTRLENVLLNVLSAKEAEKIVERVREGGITVEEALENI